jgi:hypothetical protein
MEEALIFSISKDSDGPPCIKCGSCRSGVSTVVSRGEGYRWSTVTVCEECIFKAVVGDVAYQRAVNNASTPLVAETVTIPKSDYLSLLEGVPYRPKQWWWL